MNHKFYEKHLVHPKQILLLAVPPALTTTTYIAFYWSSSRFSQTGANLCGFLFYWVFWCYLAPLLFLGRAGIRNIFKSKKPRLAQPTWLGALFLLAPVLGTFGTIFPQAVGNVTPTILAYSVLFALINGVGEELLWRGTFVSVFSESWGWGVVYPSIGFGLWHFSPLVVTAGQGPVLLVTIGPMILGVMWGWIAKQTRSIRWLACAHVLVNLTALAGRIFT
jgi:hypothetical protein